MPLVAGVDSSTQSCKVELRDLHDGELVGSGSSPHPPAFPPRSEQAPAAWWQALRVALAGALRSAGADAATVRGIAVDAQCHGLVALDDDDLIRIADDQIDIAYPFSVSPTPFAIRLPNGSDRYACCAMDALGIAPMVGQRVEIRSRCHHCEMPLEFSASIGGVSLEANGVMLWIGKRVDDRCKVADTY